MSKKGLIAYDTIYSSTNEVAYWLKALLGEDQHVEVKHFDQVISIAPYDYVIIGSYTRWEKPSKRTQQFIADNHRELAQKQVCYFLTCGDNDETMILKAPGQQAHLIAGRNYLMGVMEQYPDIKPIVIGGFGGRECMPHLNRIDTFQVWMVGKLAKESAPWDGLEIWESLVPDRVEIFANDVREKILGLPRRTDCENLRWYWNSIQPANRSAADKQKYTPKKYEERLNTKKIYFTRSRIKGDLNLACSLIKDWAAQNGIDLQEQKRSFFNVYYHANKRYSGKPITIHVVAAEFVEDPGNVQLSFRSWDKPEVRKGAEEDITKAEQMLWADGRKVG